MKGLLSFTILALVAYAAHAEPDCSAGKPDHQPHPTDCSLYYTCSNGSPILQECPPGLWWSVEMDTCDLPGNTICTAASTTTVPTTTTGSTTVTTPPSTTPTPSTTRTTPTPSTTRTTPTPSTTRTTPTPSTTRTTEPPTEGSSTTTRTTTTAPSTTTTTKPSGGDNQCPPVEDPNVIIRYPHETNCAFYYRCEKGKPILYTCQPTDHFSPTKRVCISENRAGCDSCPVEEDATETVRLPHETNCHFYYLCKAGTPNLYQCKEDLHFSRSHRECMTQSEAKCSLGQRLY